jgi:hypothetical protein
MRSCNIVFRLALRGYSADFVCGSIVAFTAGRLAFVAARGGHHPSPAEIADSIRPAKASAKSDNSFCQVTCQVICRFIFSVCQVTCQGCR